MNRSHTGYLIHSPSKFTIKVDLGDSAEEYLPYICEIIEHGSPSSGFFEIPVIQLAVASLKQNAEQWGYDFDLKDIRYDSMFSDFERILEGEEPSIELLRIIDTALTGKNLTYQMLTEGLFDRTLPRRLSNLLLPQVVESPEFMMQLFSQGMKIVSPYFYEQAKTTLMKTKLDHPEMASKLASAIFTALEDKSLFDPDAMDCLTKHPNWLTLLPLMNLQNLRTLASLDNDRALMVLSSKVATSHPVILSLISSNLQRSKFPPKISWAHEDIFISKENAESLKQIILFFDEVNAASLLIKNKVNPIYRTELLKRAVSTQESIMYLEKLNADHSFNDEEKEIFYKSLAKFPQGANELLRKKEVSPKVRKSALTRILSSNSLSDHFLRANFNSLTLEEVNIIAEKIGNKGTIDDSTFKRLPWPSEALGHLIENFGRLFTCEQILWLPEDEALRVIKKQMASGNHSFLMGLHEWSDSLFLNVVKLSIERHEVAQAHIIQTLLASNLQSKMELSSAFTGGLYGFLGHAKLDADFRLKQISLVSERKDYGAALLIIDRFRETLVPKDINSLIDVLAERINNATYTTAKIELLNIFNLSLGDEEKKNLLHSILTSSPLVLDVECLMHVFPDTEAIVGAMFSIILSDKSLGLKKEFLSRCVAYADIKGGYGEQFEKLILSQMTYYDLVKARSPKSLRWAKIKTGEIQGWNEFNLFFEEDEPVLIQEVIKTGEQRKSLYNLVSSGLIKLTESSWGLLNNIFQDFECGIVPPNFIRQIPKALFIDLLERETESGLMLRLIKPRRDLSEVFSEISDQARNLIFENTYLHFNSSDKESISFYCNNEHVANYLIQASEIESPYNCSEFFKEKISKICKELMAGSFKGQYSIETGQVYADGVPLMSGHVIEDKRLKGISLKKTNKEIPVLIHLSSSEFLVNIDEDEISNKSQFLNEVDLNEMVSLFPGNQLVGTRYWGDVLPEFVEMIRESFRELSANSITVDSNNLKNILINALGQLHFNNLKEKEHVLNIALREIKIAHALFVLNPS